MRYSEKREDCDVECVDIKFLGQHTHVEGISALNSSQGTVVFEEAEIAIF